MRGWDTQECYLKRKLKGLCEKERTDACFLEIRSCFLEEERQVLNTGAKFYFPVMLVNTREAFKFRKGACFQKNFFDVAETDWRIKESILVCNLT